MIYEDFHLLLVPDGQDGFRVHASFREQRASGPLALPSEADLSVVDTSTKEVGSRLFQALLGGEVGRLFEQVRGACETNPDCALRLRLRLHFPSGEERSWRLQGLPWELLYHPGEQRFLAFGRRMAVVRSLDTSKPLRVVSAAPPLRVLLVMANPREAHLLDLPVERKKIEHALARLKRIHIEVLERATARDMRRRLRDGRFHIVHFMGHGIRFDEAAGEGALLLESPTGEVERLSATKLAELFEDVEAPRLVVLNACDTAATSEGVDPLRSVAASLVVAGLPAVLAHRGAIWDDAALALAEELYLRLAQGDPIEAAVSEARLTLRLEERDTTGWTLPSLFVRPVPVPPPGIERVSLLLLAGSIGSLLPGFAFFMDLTPPLLSEVKLLPALAAPAVAIAFVWPRKLLEDGGHYKQEISRATSTILASLLIVLSYIAAYLFTTVSPPVPPPTITCQAGPGLAHLTGEARSFIKSHPALANPQDLMLAFAAFAGCRTDLIWNRWSIITSGVILIMLFLTASILWAFGFAWLARLLPRLSPRATRKPIPALVLLLASLSLCSCMSEHLLSSHATAAERIERLEAKAKALDARSALPAPH